MRAEEEVAPGREVREVRHDAGMLRVMPAVPLRRAEQVREGPERQTHVGVDEDRPQPAEHDERRDGGEVEAEHDARQVDEELRQHAIDRVFAMRSDPVDGL